MRAAPWLLALCGCAAAGVVAAPCDDAQREAAALQSRAREAFVERRFEAASGLYRDSGSKWDAAATHCKGAARQLAERRREETATDGHNATRCVPAFEQAREAEQRRLNAEPAERQRLALPVEMAWREATRLCRGNAAELADIHAQALARERGAAAVATAPLSLRGVDITAGDTRYRGRFTREEGQVLSGTGRVDWANGDIYEGALLRNQRNGRGLFIWANGQRYEGDWVRDEASGRGRVIYPSGDVYEGQVLRGRPEGQGLYLWRAGGRYEGAWVAGRKNGRGIYHWPNGDKWEGIYKDDEQTAEGQMTFAPGK